MAGHDAAPGAIAIPERQLHRFDESLFAGYLIHMSLPDSRLRPYDVSMVGTRLVITIRKEFDFGSLHQDWAHAIITLHPGPFATVQIEMSGCGLVSSTFLAGMMQLHFHYTDAGSQPLVISKPDPRVVRNLTIMRINTLFTIEPR